MSDVCLYNIQIGFMNRYEAGDLIEEDKRRIRSNDRGIYQKLGVNGLLQALNKAKELNIIE